MNEATGVVTEPSVDTRMVPFTKVRKAAAVAEPGLPYSTVPSMCAYGSLRPRDQASGLTPTLFMGKKAAHPGRELLLPDTEERL